MSVIKPYCRTRKTFEPMLATRCAMYRLMPEISDTTMIRVETDRMMPSSIRADRSLCARIVSNAISAGSRKWEMRLRAILSSRGAEPEYRLQFNPPDREGELALMCRNCYAHHG